MTGYYIKAYLRYKWKAMGRHGTHSPFVYDFIEHILLDSEIIPREYIVSCPGLPLRFENILSRVAAYYGLREKIFLPDEEGATIAGNIELILFGEAVPKEWNGWLSRIQPAIGNDSIVAVLGIHSSAEHGAAWNRLCMEHGVKMSIDLFGVGLLLFREEFKERQQFILKY